LDEPKRRVATIRSARALADAPRLPGSDVVRKLLPVSSRGRTPKKEIHDKIVTGSNGSPLFRVRYLSNSIAFLFAKDEVSEQSLSRVEQALEALLRKTDIERASVRRARVGPERMRSPTSIRADHGLAL
jgi:hypothetical protein